MIKLLIIFTQLQSMELKFSIIHLGDVRFTHFLSLYIFYLQLICWALHCYKALQRNKVELMK